MIIDESTVQEFQQLIYNFYSREGRYDLPWRQPNSDGTFDPYKILVSELMLQQTQVARVVPKFNQFIAQFPNSTTLADSDQAAIIRAWSGLGYNRRAIYLQQTAKQIVSSYHGRLPKSSKELTTLPGIGTNTAGAILAYAFNEPTIFIETNIRTVMMRRFFFAQFDITDRDIAEYVAVTLDRSNPRHWYWALMDYGTYLKHTFGSTNLASKAYRKQSKFHGSSRQIRGQVIRLLGERPYSATELSKIIADPRLPQVLQKLEHERLVFHYGKLYRL